MWERRHQITCDSCCSDIQKPCSSCSSSKWGLSNGGRRCSYESALCLSVLWSMIGGCQTNIERCQIRLNRLKPCMTRSARWAVSVYWQRGQTSSGVPQGSVLGPMLFGTYMSPVGDVISQHNVHYYQYVSLNLTWQLVKHRELCKRRVSMIHWERAAPEPN